MKYIIILLAIFVMQTYAGKDSWYIDIIDINVYSLFLILYNQVSLTFAMNQIHHSEKIAAFLGFP